MKPYSQDLRSRVLASAATGQETPALIAATYQVSLSRIEKWLRRKRETGQETALPPRRGRSRRLRDCAPFIPAELKQQLDSTLAELCARVAESKGMQVSPSMMCRELRHLDLRRTKSLHDSRRETPRVKRLRRKYIVRIAQVLSHCASI